MFTEFIDYGKTYNDVKKEVKHRHSQPNYHGKSSIPKLAYTNNGSYITDFFVDLNVLFNEKNVQVANPGG